MALSLRLDLRQTQGLVMTPQLQQAIKLLQLSNLELAGYVGQELEQNPLLERGERADEAAAAGDGAEPAPAIADSELCAALPLTPGESVGDGWADSPEDGWAEASRDALPDGLGVARLAPVGRGGSEDGPEPEDLGARLSRPITLREHLLEQLNVDVPDGPDRLIGAYLIDLVDDAGYLTEDLEDVARRLGCPSARVEGVLGRLQRFDPPGVGARSLKECLALQLRERDRLDPAMQALLEHLHLVAAADLPALLRVCGVLPDDLPEMIAEVKALNPRPGLAFLHETVQPAVPDVLVYPAGGTWQVELNGATLPRVLVNTTYHLELCARVRDRAAREYLSERLQSANWLVKALDQRARTVLRVAEAVVARQLPFLRHGVQALRPLILREIAEDTGLHESTVSRATADKIVATPRGDFPFRYFFSTALPATGGEASHSAEAIRQHIKSLIEREPAEQVLSDDQVVEILQRRGVVIARRTVAKYREALRIPSSVQRRRSKALGLA